MPSQLANYIKNQLKAGYSIQSIRTALYQYGYTPFQVNQALSEIYEKQDNKLQQFIHNYDLKRIGVIASIMFAVILTSFFSISFLLSPGVPELLDMESSLLDKEILPGQDLRFKIELFSLGKDARFDIELEHQLLDLDDRIKTKKIETLAIETRTSKTSTITIPDDLQPGIYQLKSIARYNGLKAISLIQFELGGRVTKREELEEPEIEEEIEEVEKEPEVEKEVEEPEVEKEVEEPIEEAVSDIPSNLPIEDQIELIGKLAKTGKSFQAIKKCEGLATRFNIDACLEHVGDISKQAKACRKIVDQSIKDRCLTSYFLNTADFSVCDEIKDKALQFSCFDLEEALA